MATDPPPTRTSSPSPSPTSTAASSPTSTAAELFTDAGSGGAAQGQGPAGTPAATSAATPAANSTPSATAATTAAAATTATTPAPRATTGPTAPIATTATATPATATRPLTITTRLVSTPASRGPGCFLVPNTNPPLLISSPTTTTRTTTTTTTATTAATVHPPTTTIRHFNTIWNFARLVPIGLSEETLEEWMNTCTPRRFAAKYSDCLHTACNFAAAYQLNRHRASVAAEEPSPSGRPTSVPMQREALRFQGNFCFNIRGFEHDCASWMLGCDTASGHDDRDDGSRMSTRYKLNVCTRARGPSVGISTRHALFSYNKHGILTVSPLTPDGFLVMTPEGGHRVTEGSYALLEPTTMLKFGELTFTFCYGPEVRSDMYLASMIRLMKRRLGPWELPAWLIKVGLSQDSSVPGYLVDRNSQGPPFGVTQLGVSKTDGVPVDIMRLSRSARNRSEFATVSFLKEIKKISATPPSIVRLREIIDEHAPVDVVVVLEPHLPTPLDETILDKSLSVNEGIIVFQQCLQGLGWLHENNMMHRNFSPAVVALATRKPVSAYIHDFGCAITGKECDINDVPVSYYSAPEMLRLAAGRNSVAYGARVDSWSAGMTGLAIFSQVLMPDPDMDRADHPGLEYRLQGLDGVPEEVLSSIRLMLSLDPKERPAPWIVAESIRRLIVTEVRGIEALMPASGHW